VSLSLDGGSGEKAVSNQDFEDVENDSFEKMFEIDWEMSSDDGIKHLLKRKLQKVFFCNCYSYIRKVLYIMTGRDSGPSKPPTHSHTHTHTHSDSFNH